MGKNILLVGGGGHCKSVLDSLLEKNEYSKVGIIEEQSCSDKEILGVPVIGCDNDLLRLYQEGYNYAFVTVGSIGNPRLRIELYNKIKTIGFQIPNIVDKTAVVSNHTTLGNGIYIGKNAVINAGSKIGNNVIINSCSLIEHDCLVEDFVHIAPGSVLCGEVQIGRETHIGAKTAIKQNIKIGSNTLIGMGSVVIHDINSHVVAYGQPCKVVSK